MKKICCVLLLSVFLFAVSVTSYCQEAASPDNKATQAMLALNYCHTSLVKILAYEDRIVLDEEYNNIINNINLTTIHDEEILTVLQNLMDTLTTYKLADTDKDILVKEYNKRIAAASYAAFNFSFKDIVAGKNLKDLAIGIMTTLPETLFKNVLNKALQGVMSGGLLGVGFVTMDSLASMGDPYQNYRDNIEDYHEKLEREIWKLDKTTIQAVNETRKTFLQVYWKLMQKYNIPDNWRLTEKQIQRAIDVFKEQDVEKKLRLLEGIQQDFAVFPPFWYELAQTSQKSGKFEQAFEIYGKIEQEHTAFFREDHDFSSSLMNKVVLEKAIQKTQPELLQQLGIAVNIPNDLKLITANSSDDWRKNLFAALQYLELNDYDTARALITKNIDMNQEVSLNTRMLGEIYAVSNDEEQLSQLIAQMCQDDNMRYQDALFLIGMIRDGKLLRETIDTFVAPSLADIRFETGSEYLGLGADTLKISLPAIWLRQDARNFAIGVKLLEEQKEFSWFEKVEFDEENKNASFVFEDIMDTDEFIEQRKQATMLVKLADIAQPVTLFVDVGVKDIAVEDSLLDKSGKTVNKAAKYVTNIFSKNQETAEAKTAKMKPVIDFAIKEIMTSSGVCYGVHDSMLEKLSACSFPNGI